MPTPTAVAVLKGSGVITNTNTRPVSGYINTYNVSSGNQSVTLPALLGLNAGATMLLEKDTLDATSHTITFTPAGSDTFQDLTTSVVLSAAGEQVLLECVQPASTRYWKIVGHSFANSVMPTGAVVGTTDTQTLTNKTFSGAFYGSNGSANLIRFNSGGAGSIDLGRQDNVATTPYMDFNSGSTSVDYDSRIMASGGTGVIGAGQLDIYTGALNLNSVPVVTASGTQTLTHKTLTSPLITGSCRSIYDVVSPAVDVYPALSGEMTVNSVGTLSFGHQNFIGTAGHATTSVNLGGTLGTPLGQFWGGWFTCGTEGGTYHSAIFGVEIDVQCKSNSIYQKIGMRINLGTGGAADDTVRGTFDDTALNVIQNDGATSWGIGIKFGTDQWGIGADADISGSWPFDSTSTIIGTSAVGNGLPANIGIDFSLITFADAAIKVGASPIVLSEMASAPVAASGEGRLYVASDGSLHYAGPTTDTEIAPA